MSKVTKQLVAAMALVCSAGSLLAADPIDVNGIDDLLEKLRTNNGSAVTLRLAAGDYNMPAVPTSTNSVHGLSSILVNKLRLVGAGATPEATKLIGTGVNRVVQLLNYGTCENLMITNGNSSVKYENLGNSTRGGCVAGTGTLTNCVVTGGLGASHGGGVAEGTTLRNCRITGNVAQFGGGTFSVSAYNTLIANNRATSTGGGGYGDKRYEGCVISNNTAASSGGGASNVSLATNTVFISNTASSYGGGVHGNSSDWTADLKYHFWNCVFTNNFSGDTGGGAYHGTLHNCTVVGNMAKYGGGISCANAYDSRIRWNTAYRGYAGGSYNKSADCILSNCVFFANIASNDTNHAYGGVIYGGHLEDCEIHGNAVFNTPKNTGSGEYSGCGVVYLAQLDRCKVHDNYSRYYGAIYTCTARDCTLWNNLSQDEGHNAHSSNLIRCDISGSGTYVGTALDSVFHDIGGSRTITAENNPFLPEGKTMNVTAISRCYGSFTNCLFRNNGTSSLGMTLMFGHSSLFEPGPMVNCTIVSNYISATFNSLKAARGKQIVENCVFVDNFKDENTRSDILFYGNSVEVGALEFTHSIYGVSSEALSGYSDGTLWKLGEGGLPASPRFAHGMNPAHPYEPRASSPLVGRGQKEDWMETAFDIRGDGFPRLRDGKADIGCYQGYLPASGLYLFLN